MSEEFYKSPASLEGGDDAVAGRDRSTRLRVMGIVQLVLGSLSALFMLFTFVGILLGSAMAPASPPDAPSSSVAPLLPSLLTYLLASLFFFVMGFGSIKARRWVRPLVLAIMWPALVFGTIGFAFTVYILPLFFDAMMPAMSPGMQIPKAVLTVIELITLGTTFLLAVAIPGLHVLVYQSRHVKETCEALDPKARWTDRCPVSVLGVAIAVAFVGLMQLSMLAFGVTWFFGFVLTGTAAVLIVVAEALAALAIAFMIYRLSGIGWWSGLAYMLFVCAKLAVSFAVLDIKEMYRSMKVLPEHQLNQMAELFEQFSFYWISIGMWLAAALVSVGYMMVIKKHFFEGRVTQ